MKNNTQKYIPFLLLCLPLGLLAQQILPDLRAFSPSDGKLAIRVMPGYNISNYFLVNDNAVKGTFYFQPDDIRNGQYSAIPVAVQGGATDLVFSNLPYQSSDNLTLSLVSNLDNGIVREYVFINGSYLSPSGGSDVPCPAQLVCTNGALELKFDAGAYTPGAAGMNLPNIGFFFGNGNLNNTFLFAVKNLVPVFSSNSIRIVRKNWIDATGSPLNCTQLLSGTITLTIGDRTCVFTNGQPVSTPNNCSPWGDYLDAPACASYFDNCLSELMDLFSTNRAELACRQWNQATPGLFCNSTERITRTDKVAIGTASYAAAMLTVKNGIVTDKIKVQTCDNGGWCDYVFDPHYKLMSLSDVEKYISTNKHLPGMPAESEIIAEGSLNVGDITFRQQEKIEEIFLHLIAMEKEVSDLEAVSSVLEMRYWLNMK
jgi:hypothetical protein